MSETAIEFQLKNLGEHFVRPQGKEADPRVEFLPDDWQRTLLNVVDAQESALVINYI
jgi:ATP-dependent RNA helicase DDX60